jgi:hypothetical protein
MLAENLAAQERDMASIPSPAPDLKPAFRRDDSDRGAAVQLIGLLAFSVAGLFTHGLALTMQGEPSLAPLRIYLIMAAAPIAALVALRFAAKAHRHAPWRAGPDGKA